MLVNVALMLIMEIMSLSEFAVLTVSLRYNNGFIAKMHSLNFQNHKWHNQLTESWQRW